MGNEYPFILTAKDRTKAVWKSFNSGMKGVKDQVLSTKTAIAGLLGVTGIGGLAIVSANATRQTVAYSRAIGINTQELTAWGYAAKTANIEQDKLNDIMKDVSDKVGDAFNNGTGPVVDALKAVNLQTRDLIGLSPDQQLLKIANAMQGLTGQQQSNILESLSGDAALLQPLLANNAAELKRLKAEAIATGAAVSDIDALRIKQAGDSFEKIKGVFGGIGNTIASELSPYVSKLSEGFIDAAIQTHGFQSAIDSAIKFGIQGVEFFADAIWSLTAAWEGVKFALNSLSVFFWDSLAGFDRGITDFLNKIPGVSAEYSTTIQGIAETAQQNLDSSWESLRAKLDEPLPSKAIADWFQSAEDAANRTAHVVNKANQDRISNTKKNDNAQLALGKKSAEDQLGITKVKALKEGLIHAKSAVIGAYKWGAGIGGPIVGGIAAAAAGAFEYGQLSDLGGGGGGSGGGGGGGVSNSPEPVPAVAGAAAAGAVSGATQQTIHVTIDGVLPSDPDQLDQLAKSIAKNVQNGGTSPV